VKKGGEFISLAEIENVTYLNRDVRVCLAKEVEDKFWGNKIKVFIELKGGDSKILDEKSVKKDLMKLYNEKMKRINVPDEIVVVENMRLTSIGKPIKFKLI
jgi:acyl-CoA synthetase (AMP-forming)/AMP-acid ligase II